jgi:hypothetical protein
MMIREGYGCNWCPFWFGQNVDYPEIFAHMNLLHPEKISFSKDTATGVPLESCLIHNVRFVPLTRETNPKLPVA